MEPAWGRIVREGNQTVKHSSTTLIIFGAVFVLGFALTALIFVPFSDQQMSEPTAVARAYGDLEAQGRELYQREGCVYCHSQQVRSLQADRPFGTRPSEAGDYAYEAPHPMGRLRIGPDLKYVGDRHSDPEWYVTYLADPRNVFPHSVKPTYDHLSEQQLQALAAYLVSLGGGYLEEDGLQVAEVEEVPLFAEVPADFAMANPLARSADVVNVGANLFDTYCATCHGQGGDGKGPASAGMSPPPAAFIDPVYREAEDAYLFWRISEGVPGTPMPPWNALLDEEEMWALVHYLREFHAE